MLMKADNALYYNFLEAGLLLLFLSIFSRFLPGLRDFEHLVLAYLWSFSLESSNSFSSLRSSFSPACAMIAMIPSFASEETKLFSSSLSVLLRSTWSYRDQCVLYHCFARQYLFEAFVNKNRDFYLKFWCFSCFCKN